MSKEESRGDVEKRRDEALRRALTTPPKPHQDMKVGKKQKAKPSASSNVSASKAAKKPSR